MLREHGAGQPFVHYLALAALFAGAWSTAERWIDAASMLAARQGTLAGAMSCAANRALILSARGDALGAEASARQALEIASSATGLEMLVPMAVAPLARARLAISGPAAAAEALEELPPHVRDLEIVTQPLWLEARANVAVADHRPHDALIDTAACRAWEARWPAEGGGWLAYRTAEVRAYLMLGEPERASAVAEEAVGRAERFGAGRQLGLALHTAALAAPVAERAERLQHAAVVLGEAGAGLDRAECLLDLGELQGTHGDAAAGRSNLEEALDGALTCGAEAVAARARDALVSIGGRPRRAAVSGVASLTPAERRVAELAATERSNREIAEELFVTEKTVENHLTAVYRKLAISSRAQVAAAFNGSQG
jgi:DNA-binding CsgD family transcriptional regulator